jgi:hypothetical protein
MRVIQHMRKVADWLMRMHTEKKNDGFRQLEVSG